MMKKKYVAAGLIAVPCALFMSGCSANDLLVDKYDESTARSADSSKQAVKDGLLPSWVPEGGTNIELMQRNTGSERIFVMNYTGKLPADQCISLETAGHPTKKELAEAYGSDPRTAQTKVEAIATTRTLEADWWPKGAEGKTTDLCGRFWVHEEGGKLYGFAPDSVDTVNAVKDERSAASSK